MATDKFNKSKVGLEAGEFYRVKLDDDGNITLEQGFSSGTFTTPVYHSDGSATKVSWTSNEAIGEINTVAGVSPKTIEMRASDVSPMTTNIVVSGATLTPDFSSGFNEVNNNWAVSVTGIKLVDNIYAGAVFKVSYGAPIVRNLTENFGFGAPGIIQVTKGAAYSQVNYDNIYTGAVFKVSYGDPIVKDLAENFSHTKGIVQISYTGGIVIS